MKAIAEISPYSLGATEKMSPEEFLKKSKRIHQDFVRVDVIPPKLGDEDFGKIRVVKKS